MKILYDHQIFTNQEYGGISRYFYELNIRSKISIEKNISCLLSNNFYLNSDLDKKKNFFKNKNILGKQRFMKFVNQNYSLFKIKQNNFDVFHPTYYSTYFLESITNKPFVITFYDMIHEKISDQFKELNEEKLILKKKLLIEKATRVIAISEQTKKDIIEIYNIRGENIDVVYLGNSLLNINFNMKPIIEHDYILFVGNRSKYKNFIGFLASVRDLLIKYNLYLICAGGEKFNQIEIDFISSLNVLNKVVYCKINNDDDLANYYHNSLFFTFPSLYEGFGIPLLESFASRAPILSSNCGSLPEIAGDAADYFNPNEPHSIFTATENLINDSNRRKILVNLGSKRLTNFSWDKTYLETLNVYNKALNI